MTIHDAIISAPYAVISAEEAATLARLAPHAPMVVAERLLFDARMHDQADNIAKAGHVRALAARLARA